MRIRMFVLAAVLCLPLAATTAQGAWLQSTQSQGIAYFLHDAPAQIQRYDLQGAAWLAPIPLGAGPRAFTVDIDGIYVAFGRTAVRLALDGTGQTPLFNTPTDIRELLSRGNVLYLFEAGGETTSVDKTSRAQIDREDYFYSMSGVSIAPTIGKIFGRSTGISPSDILQVPIFADGTLGTLSDSPYHGNYPSATRTFVFPGEARVADTSGIVYNTSNLTYSTSLGGTLDDLGFFGDLPVALRGSTVHGYDNALLPTGQYTFAQDVDRIFVHQDTVFGFYTTTGGAMGALSVPISELRPGVPGTPVDPTGLAYTPNRMELGTDGVVYILSIAHLSVFRWSIAEERYLPTIPLTQAPGFMTYSPVSQRLYLAYPWGLITRIDLAGPLTEVPFANSPQQPLGLATAGEYLFVCDPTGAWVSHFTYGPAGNLISQVEWNYYSTEYIWSPANRKMYFFRDDTSPNDLLWEDIASNGTIGRYQDTPYHSSAGILHPIRVAPDASVVVLGSGRLYDATSLAHIASLANGISDAAWLQSRLFTSRAADPYTQIQRWSPGTYLQEHDFFVQGSPLGLFSLADRLLVVSSVNGVPRFSQRGPDAGDLDADQVPDHLDNCPETANAGQADTDGDGVGDACNDAQDADGDEWADGRDNCPGIPNGDQSNRDSDRLGDACDAYPDHDLRVEITAPQFGLTATPLEVVYRLLDPSGQLLTDVVGARLMLSSGGSARFGAVREGIPVETPDDQHLLVEFVGGRVVVDVTDAAEEEVLLSGEDTEAIGIEVMADIFEDFETDDAGFVHAGQMDTWQYGVPTSGPNAAYSGQKLWATNLSGNYANGSNASLTSPAYRISGAAAMLSFRSWISLESCCDQGSVEISTTGGSSWSTLEYLGGYGGVTAAWTQRSYSLAPYAHQTVLVRFRLSSDGSIVYPGWYIDDFRIQGLATTVRFLSADGDADNDGLTNAQEQALGTDMFDPDTDNDGAPDGADNCPRASNPQQADVVHPNGVGDACDDPDADGRADAADNCPDVGNADQRDQVHPNGIGDACDDPDADGVVDAGDNCPSAENADQTDGDLDHVGTACDVCPATPNTAQTETVACLEVSENGGQCLETAVELIGEPFAGEVLVYQSRNNPPRSMRFDILATSCNSIDRLEVALNGAPIGFADLNPARTCGCLTPVTSLVVSNATLLESLWSAGGPNVLTFRKTGSGSGVAWIRGRLDSDAGSSTECLVSSGPSGCTSVDLCTSGYTFTPFVRSVDLGTLPGTQTLVGRAPFEASELPGLVAIDAAAEVGPATLCIARTGSGAGQDCKPFTLTGEQDVAINGAACGPPVAIATEDVVAECASPNGASVILDASASSDPNSSPGTNDDIVAFRWFLHYGEPEQSVLAEGETAETALPLGTHVVTLLVKDSFGDAATDTMTITVLDTVAPTLEVVLTPYRLWPANHAMIDIVATVEAADVCSPVAPILVSITSNEPDDADGTADGSTTGDIQPGADDFHFSLRAERSASGSGRVYTVTYSVVDLSGNETRASGHVRVPRNRGTTTEPVRPGVTRNLPVGTSPRR